MLKEFYKRWPFKYNGILPGSSFASLQINKLINFLLQITVVKELIELTEEFAKRIVEIENQRKNIGEILRELNEKIKINTDAEVLEEKIIIPVKKEDIPEIKVAGVDGGLVKHSLHGIDIMLIRAIGVLFHYKNDKLAAAEYHPSTIPTPIPYIIFDPFSDIEVEMNSNMERQIAEVNTAREAIEKFKPDIIFLNGSVVPHYVEKPAEHSLLYPPYRRMVEAYLKLFESARKNKTILAGVIEDSRGTRFCEIANQKILSESNKPELKILLDRTKDTNLLTYALNLSERSFVFKYSANPEDHPMLREFGQELANLVFSFYLKTAEFDRPIRIDFLSTEKTVDIANKISSLLIATASHSSYGMPPVLIEADQRAKLSEKDLETFYLDLVNKAGNLPVLFNLRRDQRPF